MSSRAGVLAGPRHAAHRPFAPPARLWVVAGLHAVALVIALAAWEAARGDSQPDDQTPWIVLASCAAALSGAVNGGWLLVSRREVGHRHQTLAARIVDLHRQQAPGTVDSTANATAGLVALAGSELYHRTGCVLVEGRPAEPMQLGQHRGRRPCGWCSP